MLESLLNKILFITFFISIFNILRHGWRVFLIIRNTEIPNVYKLSKWELVFLGLSFAYLFNTIFTGIRL